jgi:hypothetical protein
MKISSSQLITELQNIIQQHIHYVETLLQKPEEELNYRVTENSWSILECIEHLNRYGNFYIPEIRTKIAASKYAPEAIFSSGILGEYFASSMLPKEKLKKNEHLQKYESYSQSFG